MDTLIEAIGECVKDAIDDKKPLVARGILSDTELWYEVYLKRFYKTEDLLRDSVFMAVYRCGYDNIDWNDVTTALEVHFCDDIDELENEKKIEEEEEEEESYSDDEDDDN
jgi:uncharacterized protein YdaU (DUF1376 family)